MDVQKKVGGTNASNGLGVGLRARRRALGKTLQQVADECGLTVGFISQIERGISVPSLASLCSVANALETSVDRFLLQAPMRQHSIVSHSGTRPADSVGGPERCYEFLERGFPEALLNAALTHVPPGYTSEIMTHAGEEFLYIVRGEMIYDVDDKTDHLKPGRHCTFNPIGRIVPAMKAKSTALNSGAGQCDSFPNR